MKRIIKFRVWDKELKQMDYYPYVYFGTNHVAFVDDKDLDYIDDNSEDKDNFELMQFIGIKDKRGVEIYEGDIVEYVDKQSLFESGIYKIGFDRGSFCFNGLGEYEDDMVEVGIGYPDFPNIGKYLVVVGNIYKDPEIVNKNRLKRSY